MLKRGVDILIAGLLLIFSAPFMFVCAVLVKVDSTGPALFRQVRMGRHFKTFKLLKLRTMHHGANGAAFTLGFDVRVTRIGCWLRSWKLDEVPQLWNVLRGEMSLVGPRPVIPELAREFSAEYNILLRVRPGLTDPATVQYCREAEILSQVADPLLYFKTVVTPEKLRLSSDYLAEAGLASDLVILIRTARAVLFPAHSRVLAPDFETLPQPVSPVSSTQD